MHKYSETLTVRQYELGPDFRVRLQSVCNYMEEAAGHHAAGLGVGLEDLKKTGQTWVLAKMRLVLEDLPTAGAEVAVTTWPVGVERLVFRRDFTLAVQGRVFLRAVTHWVIMGLASRRLERIPAHIAALQPENPSLALQDGDIRIPGATGSASAGPAFPVRLADIDQNGHVNNVRYAEFVLEDACLRHKKPRRLAGMDLVFKTESLYGDTVLTAGGPDPAAPEKALLHTLVRERDGSELVRARTFWR